MPRTTLGCAPRIRASVGARNTVTNRVVLTREFTFAGCVVLFCSLTRAPPH